jgi:hypothetical protein
MPDEKHVDMHDPDAVIAERILKRCDTGGPVVFRVFKPVPDAEQPDSTWACGFEIHGLDEPVRDRVLGVDSMQALKMSFQGIRYHLQRCGVAVGWEADTPGSTGFERYHSDPDTNALMEQLIEIEMIRQLTLYEQLDPTPDRKPGTDELLEHTKEAEAIRQRILRRILERGTKQRG